MKEEFLLYDGDCLFCNRIAYFLSPKDREGRFLYIANTSQKGMDICKQYHLEELTQKTIVVKIGENFYIRSQAVYYFLSQFCIRLHRPAAKVFRQILSYS